MHYQLKVTLLCGARAPWRRVVVPLEYTLGDLHYVITAVMGWRDDEHLHEFHIKRQTYSLDTFYGGGDECEAVLGTVVKPRGKFEYIYDLGACWTHEIVVEAKVARPKQTPQCIAGSRAAPPDGCSPLEFSDALRMLRSKNEDVRLEAKELLGESFDPATFDRDAANRRLDAIFQATSEVDTVGRSPTLE